MSYATIASTEGPFVVLVTANPTSALARLADVVVEIPVGATGQFGGSLFEQTSLLVLDAAVLALSNSDLDTYRGVHQRHTDLQ